MKSLFFGSLIFKNDIQLIFYTIRTLFQTQFLTLLWLFFNAIFFCINDSSVGVDIVRSFSFVY